MLSQKLMLVFSMEPMAMVLVLDMLDSDMDILVLAMLVLATMARGLLMLSQRLMLVCTMEDMDMVLVWDMLDLDMDIRVLDMLDMVVMDLAMAILVLVTMARGLLMLSQSLKLMPIFSMEPMAMVLVLDMLDSDMDILVLDMLDMVVMDLAMAVLAMLVLDTMARGLLMLKQRLMLVCTMEDMDMVLDLDMDIPVLDMPDMVVMDSDTVLDMDVPSMVKYFSNQFMQAKAQSNLLIFSVLFWVGIL